MECTCQKEFFESSSSSSNGGDENHTLSVSEQYGGIEDAHVLDFGLVPVGKEATKVLKFRNDSDEHKVIRFKRDARSNPIYHCFDLDTYEKSVAPHAFLEQTVTYKSTIPHRNNRDYFSVVIDGKLIYNVTCKAESVGPCVNASATSLYFYKCAKRKKKKNILELQNTTDVDTVFEFDVNDGQQDVFIVKPIRGLVPANKRAFVEIFYTPKETGQHFARLPCLIHYHEPIIIEAMGVYSLHENTDPAKISFTHYLQPREETSGFSGYLGDCLKMRTYIPPVSLSENILDFGRVLPADAYNRMCTVSNCLTMVTSLTNHSDTEIEIIWEKDCDNVFSISPQKVIIPSKESILFECHFYPNYEDQLYFKILTAQIIWMQTTTESINTELFIPLLISLRLLGHSFPQNTQWIPRVAAPVNVILPSTLPSFSTRNTFLIQSKGHLPVLFKFLPPNNSFFVVKPMAGIIRQFQIIVVQMQTVSTQNSGCIEQWQLEINGQKDRRLEVYFKGQVEYPSVIIGNSNFIKFDCIHPGCQGVKREAFRNEVSYPLRYEFVIDNHPYLSISAPSGELQSGEVTYLDWYFLSSVHGPYKVNVKCDIRAIQNIAETIGPPFETYVTLAYECSYSQLCATPNSHNFGNLRFRSQANMSFTMFNFGKSPLYIVLHCDIPKELKNSIIDISPVVTSVGCKEQRKVDIHLKLKDLGAYHLKIFYSIRMNEMSGKIINEDERIQIFSFDFQCSWPTLQITEILDYNFGPLFSKANLWEIHNINEFNRVLGNIGDGESKSVEITVPDMEAKDWLCKTVMLVQNLTNLDETLIIKKQQNCQCKTIPVSVSLTRRKMVYKCPHRLMSDLYLNHGTIEANSSAILTLEVNYLLPAIIQSVYLLTLSHNRKIRLTINIKGIPKRMDAMLPSKYSMHYDLTFQNVFIGEKEPMAKGFWFYNNTDIGIKYEVAVKVFEEVNSEGERIALRCLNPKGMIDSHSALPLIIQFVPNNIEPIDISLPVYFERQLMVLNIKANGSLLFTPVVTKPIKPEIESVVPSVSFSIRPQLITIPFMSVWNYAEKLIFITNQTDSRTYKFLFQVALIEGIVKVEAWPASGTIKPRQTYAVTLRITSFDLPCEIQLNLSCRFLDETQRRDHEASLQNYFKEKRYADDVYEAPQSTRSSRMYSQVSQISQFPIIPEPQFVYQTVSIRVRILSMCDRDLHLNVVQQKILTPQLDVRLNNREICSFLKHGSHMATYKRLHKKINLANIRIYENTIYAILRDVIHSVFFTNIVETLKNSPPCYYFQFKFDKQFVKPRSSLNLQEYVRKCTNEAEHTRRQMMDDFLKRPQNYILAKVFQQLIFESVCDVFKLKGCESK